MKYMFAFLLLLAVWARADLFVEQKIESSAYNSNMVIRIKGDKARMDVKAGSEGDVTVLIDATAGELVTLLHERKQFLKVDIETAKKQTELQAKAAGIDPSKVGKPNATGKKEKIGEWQADIYEVEFSGKPAKFWVAKDFPNYKSIMEQLNKIAALTGGAGFDPRKLDFGGMVVKSERDSLRGRIVSTLVSAKEETVEDSVFAMPSGYSDLAPK